VHESHETRSGVRESADLNAFPSSGDFNIMMMTMMNLKDVLFTLSFLLLLLALASSVCKLVRPECRASGYVVG
jgi:hypothetical protein